MKSNSWKELSKELPEEGRVIIIVANFITRKLYGIGKLDKSVIERVVVKVLPSPFYSYYDREIQPKYCGNVFWKYLDESDLPPQNNWSRQY